MADPKKIITGFLTSADLGDVILSSPKDEGEPLVLAVRNAFPPNEGMTEIEIARLNEEARKRFRSLPESLRSVAANALPMKTVIERMRNGLSEKSEKERREILIREFRLKKEDTGSPEVQIALLTARIENLQKHLGRHSKDFSSKRGLLQLASRRMKLLRYLKREDVQRYSGLIKIIGLRDSA